MAENNTIFRDHHAVDAVTKLAWIDRIRVLFGARLTFRAEIGLPWRTEIIVKTSLIVDKFWVVKEKEAANEVQPA